MKRRTAFILMIAIFMTLISGCDVAGLDKDKEEEETVIIKESNTDKVQRFSFSGENDLIGLNPLLNTTSPDNSVHQIVFEGLVRNVTDQNGRDKIKPGVAEDWDISQDGKRYIFYIREDARWNDGVPITSDDFVYTFRKMADPKVGATNAWLFDDVIENFSASLYNEGLNPDYDKRPEEIGVRAVDGRTIEFKLERPNPSFLELLDKARPVRQDKFEEWGEDYGRTIDKTLMNGQFVVEEWSDDSRVKMKKNDKYWNQHKVKLDTVERVTINDKDEEIRAFLEDEIDVIDVLDSSDKKIIEDQEEHLKIINNPGTSPEFMVMNGANKYLKNDKVRLALSLSVDRKEYVDKFKSNSDEVLYSLIPGSIKIGDRTYADRIDYKNDIIKELRDLHKNPKKLLMDGIEEEGWEVKPEDISLKYAIKDQGEEALEEANWLKERWEDKLGIEIEVVQVGFEDLLASVNTGDFDLVSLGWEPDFNDPASLLELFNPKSGFFNSNKIGWKGPSADEYQTILKDAAENPDNNERAYLLLEAEKILLREGIVAPIYTPSTSLYIKDFIEGFNRSPHTSVDFTNIYTFGR